jgi:prepilin-type N-terminal cleavage/methylation domain-containing protein
MRSRSGFTLIELLVAMALTLFVMVILSQAFVMSLDTFSAMKGIGDMQINLRTAEILIRDDLNQDHFTAKRRLSDPNLLTQPPLDGFFAIRRNTAASNVGGAPYFFEGTDAFGMPSYRAVDHLLYMTVKRKGNRLESFYNAAIVGNPLNVDPFFAAVTAYNMPPSDLANSTWAPQYTAGSGSGIYASQWCEVLYYLIQTGTTEAQTDPTSLLGTPTFGLYRAQFVMVPESKAVSGQPNFPPGGNPLGLAATTFAAMSCNPGPNNKLKFYSPTEAALGQRVIPDISTFNPSLGNVQGSRVFTGATLVCPNVLSFQVQVMQVGSSSFDDITAPGAPFYFDTAKFNVAGYIPNGLKAIQITLRVWDNKTRQTRQVTIAQDL